MAGLGSAAYRTPLISWIFFTLVLLRQAGVVRAALEHGVLELPLLVSLEVLPAATLVAPADCALADVEGREVFDRREPVPLAPICVWVFAALVGTRGALWTAPLLHGHGEGLGSDGEAVLPRRSGFTRRRSGPGSFIILQFSLQLSPTNLILGQVHESSRNLPKPTAKRSGGIVVVVMGPPYENAEWSPKGPPR